MSEIEAGMQDSSSAAGAAPLPIPPQELFAALYADLRRVAARELRRNGPSALSPTTLLHETYLNLAPRTAAHFSDRAHFMRYSACTMRRLLIDHLRSHHRLKRGGSYQHIDLSSEEPALAMDDPALERLNNALQALAVIDTRLAECVDLKFFCGFSMDDIAQLWQVSERTVRRDWQKACLLLRTLMKESDAEAAAPLVTP